MRHALSPLFALFSTAISVVVLTGCVAPTPVAEKPNTVLAADIRSEVDTQTLACRRAARRWFVTGKITTVASQCQQAFAKTEAVAPNSELLVDPLLTLGSVYALSPQRHEKAGGYLNRGRAARVALYGANSPQVREVGELLEMLRRSQQLQRH